MTALIPLFIKFLPYLVQAAASVPEITTFIASFHKHLSQSTAWTPAEQDAFDQETADLKSDPYWKPHTEAA